MRAEVEIGQALTCAETGKAFVAEKQGSTVNFATDDHGNVFSDEGVDLLERRELLDRSKPFTGYLSSDAKRLTGWKGNVLGHVVSSRKVRLTRWSHVHGATILAVRVRDMHGGFWWGRSNGGISINLRPTKGG